jgi:hypothetical protein
MRSAATPAPWKRAMLANPAASRALPTRASAASASTTADTPAHSSRRTMPLSNGTRDSARWAAATSSAATGSCRAFASSTASTGRRRPNRCTQRAITMASRIGHSARSTCAAWDSPRSQSTSGTPHSPASAPSSSSSATATRTRRPAAPAARAVARPPAPAPAPAAPADGARDGGAVSEG